MLQSWFIAAVISGGLALWIYGKLLHNNGNQRDSTIAAIIIWVFGFFVLAAAMKAFGIY